MVDFIDRAILIGLGLEQKLKELVSELEKKGKESKKKEGEAAEKGEELSAPQKLENVIVEDVTKTIRDMLSILKEGKERLTGVISSSTEDIAEKLNLATREELEIVKEMAQVAREKVDELEKKLEAIEKKAKKHKD